MWIAHKLKQLAIVVADKQSPNDLAEKQGK